MTVTARRVPAAQPARHAPIVQPGRNCWRLDRADRFACIQDGADYFRLVREAMLKARRTIFTLGWDTSAYTDLLPGIESTDAPKRLDRLLRFIARRRPDLRCYILTWDYGVVHTLERDPFTRWRLGWTMPPNVRFAFDDRHAVGGCHHQKVIVIDDQLAFSGSLDLTGHRWDTSAHRVDDPARVSLACDAYGPYHEVQAMVSGPSAAALGELARDRWRVRGVDDLPPLAPSTDDLWPSDVTPDLTNVPVAISRTVPPLDEQPAVRECEALFEDSIALAKRAIVIESQYFSDDRLAGALAVRLREPDGPEVIIITPKECHGWLEQETMGVFRARAFRLLMEAGAHQRLRVVYPAASQSRDVPTFIHSKVMFVDDRLARIGSANFSKRSMGVDTECDLAVDAGRDDRLRAGIRLIRDRLLGEHLGMPAEDVAREIDARGSIAALIDARADADHTLVRVDIPTEMDPPPAVLRVTADPRDPLDIDDIVESIAEPALDSASERAGGRFGLLLGLAAAGAAVGGLAAILHGTRQRPSRETRGGAWGATGRLAVLMLGTAVGLGMWHTARQVSAVESRHRARAEFG
jgi:phosphatidylserine/phosphatidylglycerophosphate/cardiolipin synthase-like enzyme